MLELNNVSHIYPNGTRALDNVTLSIPHGMFGLLGPNGAGKSTLNRRGGTHDDYIFPSRVNYMGHLSTRQYARLVDELVTAVGLNVHEYGTHSMRRTKGSMIYKATGNLRAIQILLGHSNIENTIRYLGVDIDDAITLAERTEI